MISSTGDQMISSTIDQMLSSTRDQTSFIRRSKMNIFMLIYVID